MLEVLAAMEAQPDCSKTSIKMITDVNGYNVPSSPAGSTNALSNKISDL